MATFGSTLRRDPARSAPRWPPTRTALTFINRFGILFSPFLRGREYFPTGGKARKPARFRQSRKREGGDGSFPSPTVQSGWEKEGE
jgi:hypothetical protein